MEVYYIREHLDKLKDKSLFYFFVIVYHIFIFT
jgi:hypothetical protein